MDEESYAYIADKEPYTDPAHWSEEDYEEEADAYVADGDDAYEHQWGDDGWDEFSAYVADEWANKWGVEDAHEQAQLQCMLCLFDTLGHDIETDAGACSDFIQNGSTAMMATRGKGGTKGKKGKKYPVRPSNLSIEDRRKKLAELKSKTECKDCGRRGHWRGDRECTMKKTAHLAVAQAECTRRGQLTCPKSTGTSMSQKTSQRHRRKRLWPSEVQRRR